MAGCASPGTPKPPSLHLPEVVSDLAAERLGDTVRLSWTTSSKTTDGLPMRGTVTAQICRRAVRAEEICLPVKRLPVRPGATEAIDLLPASLVDGAGTVLEYRIELHNASERSAELSSPALVAGGAAPPPVTGLQAEATRVGALLRWRPEDAADAVELERVPEDLESKPVQHLVGLAGERKIPAVVRLRADRADAVDAPFAADAGGMVDSTAARGESYVYTARRVRRVVIDGHALELRSTLSAPVKVTMRDLFPPQAPVGVEAIAGERGGVLAIDLSWTPNTEDDLAGYIVYRREGDEMQNVRVTPSLVVQPAFRDTGLVAAHTYLYTVKAVDRTGNQSPPSIPVRETTP